MNTLPGKPGLLKELGAKATDTLLDLMLDKSAIPVTIRDLQHYQHLSTLRYLRHTGDNVDLMTLTSDEFKAVGLQEVNELHAYQYYLRCHQGFPSNVQYCAA